MKRFISKQLNNNLILKMNIMEFENKSVYNNDGSSLFSYHYYKNCSFSKNSSIYKLNFGKRSFRSRPKTFDSKCYIKFDIRETSNYNKSFNGHKGGKLI